VNAPRSDFVTKNLKLSSYYPDGVAYAIGHQGKNGMQLIGHILINKKEALKQIERERLSGRLGLHDSITLHVIELSLGSIVKTVTVSSQRDYDAPQA
jgi:hypothetical protein